MTQAPPMTAFIPIAPNPFIVGNPVRDRSMFFGREAEFELVRKRFQDSDHGGLLVFCGERRSGKTSILFQILDRRLGPDFTPVLIDMQSMAIGNEVEFLTRLSQEILEALGPDAAGIATPVFREGTNHSGTFLKFMEEVVRTRGRKKIILLFDEYELFESKIDAGLLAEDTLHVLASLMESQPVFLVFTGSEHLEQRRRDYWKILGRSIYKRISFLEREDALNLMRRPVEGRVRYADGVVEAIYRLAAGQAFYTQAICQSLVDLLNERSTYDATHELLAQVVDGLVNNPLPQMIFMWDGLERDEKLVLALLAECVPEATDFAGVDALLRHLRKREYPLELEKARIATALEKLFKTEMLLRSDQASLPEYAFRMDLWRRWIRRQHSVWQVMREEGLEIRKRPVAAALSSRWAIMGGLAMVVVAALAALVFLVARNRDGHRTSTAGAPAVTTGPTATFMLDVQPAEAAITLNDRRVGIGLFHDRIAAGQENHFRVTAAGFADSEFSFTAAAGDSQARRVALRERRGDLRIETQPPGAEIRIDGRPRGSSPVLARGLGAARSHRIEATMTGFGVAARDITPAPDTVGVLQLVLQQGTAAVMVTVDPLGSEIRVDGTVRGVSPARLTDLPLGRHKFSAARHGYLPSETTLVVDPSVGEINLRLMPEPWGVLVVQGDRVAKIYIDDALVREDVQNSGPRPLPPGPHKVRVILGTGETIDTLVSIASRERAIFDFSQDKIIRRPERGD
jgi:hypothetical protein